ncbi:carbamoyltransferase [Polycladidibacter stylochi]|uniref:carbamoyltransferase family protein n=1 Tax=Polycladidibacter stylochi TaxID=1807766 RepID=UPI000830076A|nr:carbamoyltransferase [Pseudovibrio stylochi]
MNIIGISAYYHDSAAALISDGDIIAAVQEERFTRKKHDASFPAQSCQWLLTHSGLKPQDIDYVVFYDKPFLKFERLLETYLAFAPRGFSSFRRALPLWIKDKLFQKQQIIKALQQSLGDQLNWQERLMFSEHHLSHAASAFFPSPFEEAAILTLDGVGEWTTTSMAMGAGSGITPMKSIEFPHSLGLLYSAFTQYTGFKVNSGEYKVMGLAPYGTPRYADLIKQELIDIAADGSFRLNMRYFDYCTGLSMTNKHFHRLFGGPPRAAESKLTQKQMDLAASVQKVCEEVILKLASDLKVKTGAENLCLAGGVALNCVANGLLQAKGIFKEIWVQPAAGDAGGALGAALALYHAHQGTRLKSSHHTKPSTQNTSGAYQPQDKMQGAYLGPNYTSNEIEAALNSSGASYQKYTSEGVVEQTAQALAKGQAIGWMNGAMEFGPRALGARSIIADPRSPNMQRQLNLKVKFRESFRPFAPSVLEEELENWFDLKAKSPYMLMVAQVARQHQIPLSSQQQQLFGIEKLNVPRSQIPAITHVDYSARIQTVSAQTNPRYHALISRFFALTGCPIVVNTSFNVRGEPIVCTPQDAFRCFMGTELDMLVIGDFVLEKKEQNPKLRVSYEAKYELD